MTDILRAGGGVLGLLLLAEVSDGATCITIIAHGSTQHGEHWFTHSG